MKQISNKFLVSKKHHKSFSIDPIGSEPFNEALGDKWRSLTHLYFSEDDAHPQATSYARDIDVVRDGFLIDLSKEQYGEYLRPDSIRINGTDYMDDGDGRLVGENEVVGYVIYSHGFIFMNREPTSLMAQSTVTVHTLHIRAKVLSHEFNYSLKSGFEKKIEELVEKNKSQNIQEVLSPYITSLGLYNDEGQLLALAKFSLPIRKSIDIDMTFEVRLDV